MEIGAYSAGLQGFSRAQTQITQDTANINNQTLQEPRESARAESSEPRAVQQTEQSKSLESSVVDLNSELNVAKANVESIQTADEVLGSIIDIRV